MRTSLVLLALTLVTAGMTGCLGGEDSQTNASPSTNQTLGEQSTSSQPLGDANLSAVPYAGIEEPYQATTWINGSFSTTDSCLGGGCAFLFTSENPPHTHHVDITDQVPPNVPVDVTATLSWTHRDTPAFPVPTGSFSLYPNTEHGTVYETQQTASSNQTQLNATLVRTPEDPASLVIDVFLADPAGTSYTLNVTTRADPYQVQPGIPIAIPLETEQAQPLLDAANSNASAFEGLHWGPDDTLLERPNASLPLQLNHSAPGEHILAPLDGAPAARLYAQADTVGPMRALTLATELGEAHTVSPQGQASWSLTVDDVPYQAGLYTRSQNGQIEAQAEAELTSPKGPLVTTGPRTTTCLACAGLDDVWMTPPGDPALVAGEWSGTYESQASTNTEVGTLFIRYVR